MPAQGGGGGGAAANFWREYTYQNLTKDFYIEWIKQEVKQRSTLIFRFLIFTRSNKIDFNTKIKSAEGCSI